MSVLRVLSVAFVALAVALFSSTASADTWLLPEIETFESANKLYRFTVIPRALEHQLAYFEDAVAGRQKSGQHPFSYRTECRGALEALTDEGTWQQLWERELVNDVAPVRVIVADSGSHVVTTDNWHSAGYGSNAVVIYGPDGVLVRQFALLDFLREREFKRLPRTASSIGWGSGHYFTADGNLVLRARKQRRRYSDPTGKWIEVTVRLKDGEVLGRRVTRSE